MIYVDKENQFGVASMPPLEFYKVLKSWDRQSSTLKLE